MDSNNIDGSIADAPLCRAGQRLTYSGARQEMIKVLCELDSNPTNVTFAWKFNSSATEFLDLPASHIYLDRNNAIVTYTPMTEHVCADLRQWNKTTLRAQLIGFLFSLVHVKDYGTLLCWGANEIGAQVEPCVFTIVPSGRTSFTSLELLCWALC